MTVYESFRPLVFEGDYLCSVDKQKKDSSLNLQLLATNCMAEKLFFGILQRSIKKVSTDRMAASETNRTDEQPSRQLAGNVQTVFDSDKTDNKYSFS